MAKGEDIFDLIAWGSAASEVSIAADGGVATTIQLLAIGARPSRNGKPPVVRVDDRAHADAIVSATSDYHGPNDPMVDYDHQSFFGARPGVGGQAKASGWMRRIFATDAGVFADVEWTPAAQGALAAREYRYISPAFRHDANGRVLAIVNAALTNTPSLDLAAVASANTTTIKGADMSLSRIAEALGLGSDASEEEVLRAIANMSGAAATMTAVASALGVVEGGDLVATAAAIKTQAGAAPDPAKFVPVATVAALQTSLQSVQGQLDTLAADKRKAKIDAAQAAGTLPPALVAHASGITNDAQLDAFLSALPTGGLGIATVADAATLAADGKLTADQVALCSAMGWDETAYAEQLKKEAA